MLNDLIQAMRPRKVRTFQEFAEQEIIIPDGRYKNLKFSCAVMPWTALLLAVFTAGKFIRYFFTGSRQSGKTLCVFQIPVLYHLFEMEEDVIVGVPKMDLAQGIWKKRLLPIIKKTKYAHLVPTRGIGSRGGSKFEEITFDNGATLRFLSKGMSYTARVAIFTEIDYMDTGGDSSREGSPLAQIEECVSSYGDMRRIYGEGITTVEEGAAYQEVFINGTGTEIHLQCAKCKAYVVPKRAGLIGWQTAKTEKEAAREARYECPECKYPWTEKDREKALEKPLLMSQGQEVKNGKVIGQHPDVFTFGMRWNRMHSSLTTMADIATHEWRVQRSEDPEDERGIMQYVWSEPYRENLSAIPALSYRNILKKICDYKRGEVPADTAAITLGIDIGWYICWWVAVAWRDNTEGFVIDYGALDVPQSFDSKPQAIYARLMQFKIDVLDRGFQERAHDLALVDAQFEPDAVYKFIKDSGPLFMAVQGMGSSDKHRWKIPPTKAIGDRNWYVNKQKNNMPMVHAHSDYWKQQIHTGVTAPAGTRGCLQLYNHPEIDHLQFAKQIAAERMVISYETGKEKISWDRGGRANHYLDCLYYARVAAEIKGIKVRPMKQKATGTARYDQAKSGGYKIGR